MTSVRVERDPMASRTARSWVAEQLVPVGLETEVFESIVLAASELVTNVLVHTESDPQITLTIDLDEIRVEVEDECRTPAAIRDAQPGTVGGWGLRIVERVADTWGTVPGGDGSKVVWFAVEIDSDPR